MQGLLATLLQAVSIALVRTFQAQQVRLIRPTPERLCAVPSTHVGVDCLFKITVEPSN